LVPKRKNRHKGETFENPSTRIEKRGKARREKGQGRGGALKYKKG